MKVTIITLLLLGLFSCKFNVNEWQKVEGLDATQCLNRKTEYFTNHQGEHTLNACSIRSSNDTLYIYFTPELPAFWLGAELKISNNMFNATVFGVPFVPSKGKVSHKVIKQSLNLEKQQYYINDTLKGYVNLVFEENNSIQKSSIKFYLKGCIYGIVHPSGYNPTEDDSITKYDMELAVNELGEPLHEKTFTTIGLPEFRVSLLNHLPPSNDITIRELTWNTSDDAEVSDAGIERLTIWYKQKDGLWLPVDFIRWTTDMQF